MAQISYKSIAVAAQVKSLLGQRLPSLAAVASTDSDGYPLLSLGTLTASGGGILVKFYNYEAQRGIFTDSLGNASYPYGPMVIQVAVEASATTGVTLATLATLGPVLGDLLALGARTEVWLVTNGQNVVASAFAGTNSTLNFTYDSLQYPALSAS